MTPANPQRRLSGAQCKVLGVVAALAVGGVAFGIVHNQRAAADERECVEGWAQAAERIEDSPSIHRDSESMRRAANSMRNAADLIEQC